MRSGKTSGTCSGRRTPPRTRPPDGGFGTRFRCRRSTRLPTSLKPSYWRARGKLDVPKERFISYAAGAISGVPELFGWAGWDHLEQAHALSNYFTDNDKVSEEEMTPLLAGLLELQPWLTQWHNEIDPNFGQSLAAFFDGHRKTLAGSLGLTDDDLRAWRPAPATRGRKAASTSK
ncbi:DUF7008 domain-containing protein [Yinghuangia aomiensis]